jgi:hypothetical protein
VWLTAGVDELDGSDHDIEKDIVMVCLNRLGTWWKRRRGGNGRLLYPWAAGKAIGDPFFGRTLFGRYGVHADRIWLSLARAPALQPEERGSTCAMTALPHRAGCVAVRIELPDPIFGAGLSYIC